MQAKAANLKVFISLLWLVSTYIFVKIYLLVTASQIFARFDFSESSNQWCQVQREFKVGGRSAEEVWSPPRERSGRGQIFCVVMWSRNGIFGEFWDAKFKCVCFQFSAVCFSRKLAKLDDIWL